MFNRPKSPSSRDIDLLRRRLLSDQRLLLKVEDQHLRQLLADQLNLKLRLLDKMSRCLDKTQGLNKTSSDKP